MTEELNGGCLDERAAMRAALWRILEEPKNTLSDGKALKTIVRIAKEALASEARASLSTSKQEGVEPVGWQVRGIGREDGPGEWRHADAEDVEAYRNGPDMWELRPVFAAPGAAIAAREQVEPMPEGWKLVEKKTCYVLLDGDTVVASLAGPESVHYAAILARAIATPAAAIPAAPSGVTEALRAFVDIKPLGYGAKGTRDIDMAQWNEAHRAALVCLAALTQPTTVQQAGVLSALRRISLIEIERGMDGDEAIERGIAAVGMARAALKTAQTTAQPGDKEAA
jgi:hypothetical protein